MEILPIVDKKNKIIGRLPRAIIHRNKLWHRAVLIIITDSTGKIFVQKRSKKKDAFPGYYEASVSGHVEVSETAKQAAVRELREELHVTTTIKRLEQLGRFKLFSQSEREFVTAFLLKNYRGTIHCHSEVSWGKFLGNWKKLKPFHPGSAKALRQFRSFLSNR